jgi:NTE family protein
VSRLLDVLEPNNLRPLLKGVDVARSAIADLREDLSFARTLWRTLRPGPRGGAPRLEGPVFPPLRPWAAPELAGKRIAVVASGGSGATAALVGVRRAFEEAGLEPVLISACSGATLFASLWACGLTSDEIARFWLDLPTRGYVDPSWRDLARAVPRSLRGWSGLLRGEAIEASYRDRLGDVTLADTKIPLAAVVWNIDRNRVEFLSRHTRPTLSIAKAARIAISIPIMVQPVHLGDAWYGDGGIVDIFPIAPLADEQPIDHVIGTNTYLPERFEGEWVPDWYQRSFSVLRASGQLRYALYVAHAREHMRALGDRLELLHPVPYEEVRGAKFYESFLDRREWPRYMRLGHTHARRALERLSRRARLARFSATAARPS